MIEDSVSQQFVDGGGNHGMAWKDTVAGRFLELEQGKASQQIHLELH